MCQAKHVTIPLPEHELICTGGWLPRPTLFHTGFVLVSLCVRATWNRSRYLIIKRPMRTTTFHIRNAISICINLGSLVVRPQPKAT